MSAYPYYVIESHTGSGKAPAELIFSCKPRPVALNKLSRRLSSCLLAIMHSLMSQQQLSSSSFDHDNPIAPTHKYNVPTPMASKSYSSQSVSNVDSTRCHRHLVIERGLSCGLVLYYSHNIIIHGVCLPGLLYPRPLRYLEDK